MVFISRQKLFSFSRYFSFCLDFLVVKQNGLMRKDKVNFKFYDATAWLTNIVIQILLNISRSKGNQTMKFGQLTECNMRNIFLEKPYTK